MILRRSVAVEGRAICLVKIAEENLTQVPLVHAPLVRSQPCLPARLQHIPRARAPYRGAMNKGLTGVDGCAEPGLWLGGQ